MISSRHSKEDYDAVKTTPIQSKDLAKLLGYKYGTEQSLFKKINSMLAYGILEGRGIVECFKIGRKPTISWNCWMEKESRLKL